MTPPGSEFDLNLLSQRERDVVDLAVEGRTDEQIAQLLSLSVSTVNSYWVRIRGKVGQLSRTEIVGGVLRREFQKRQAALQAENAALRAELQDVREARGRAEAALRESGGAPWSLLALEALPCAALVVRAPGVISYANPHASLLLRRERAELIGHAVWELTLGEDQAAWERSVRRFFDDAEVRRTSVGVERAHYVVRGDGSNFRATVVAESFETGSGVLGVVTFREYLDELESIVRVLRQPFSLT